MPESPRSARVLRAGLLLAALPLAAAAAPGLARAGTVEGAGAPIDDVRALAPFSSVVVNGPVDVRMKPGPVERAVVRAQANIAPLIETRVERGRLVVGPKPATAFRTRGRLRAEVTFRELNRAVVAGSGDLRIERVRAPIFEATLRASGDVSIDSLEAEAVALSLSGSGDFSASGRASRLGVVIEGAGDVRADRLQARAVGVRIRGSGDARVHATETLQVDLAGSGDVRYRGAPTVTKKVAGSGEVAPLR